MPPSEFDGQVVALGVLEERVQELMFCFLDAEQAGVVGRGRMRPLGLVGRLTGGL